MAARFLCRWPGIPDCCRVPPRSAPTTGLLAKAREFTGLIWTRMSVSRTSWQGERRAKARNLLGGGSKPAQAGLFPESSQPQHPPDGRRDLLLAVRDVDSGHRSVPDQV